MIGWTRIFLGLLLAGLLGAALVVVGPVASPAYACDCSAPSDPEAFAQSDAVFVGELVDYQPPPPASVMSSTDPATWVFDVSEVYKGEVLARQEIVSEVSGASCGLEIPRQGEFVVFATEEGWQMEVGDGQYYAGLCGGTRSTSEGALAVDVASYAPHPVSTSSEANPNDTEAALDGPAATESSAGVLIAAAALAVVAVASLMLLWRRAGARRSGPA